MSAPLSDRPAKLARLQEILDARKAPALLLTSAESLAWLLDGARVTVPYAGQPVCSALVDGDGSIRVTALSNESERLRAEELGDGIEIAASPWYEPLPEPPAGAVVESHIVPELRAARARLLPLERARYAALGSDMATAMTDVLQGARPDDTERDLAARLVEAVVARGAEPVVTLVAGEQRGHLPHPLPTAARLGRRAMAVVGARRHGLIANLTRWVSFGAAPSPHDAALREVEADAYAATVPGRALREVLADIASSYARHGLGENAWRAHHQGGPTGYVGRDPKATPASTDRVSAGQAFAWNPWVPGAKTEDTVVVDGDGFEVLTLDPNWPTTVVRSIPRPLTLELE